MTNNIQGFPVDLRVIIWAALTGAKTTKSRKETKRRKRSAPVSITLEGRLCGEKPGSIIVDCGEDHPDYLYICLQDSWACMGSICVIILRGWLQQAQLYTHHSRSRRRTKRHTQHTRTKGTYLNYPFRANLYIFI